MAALLLALMLPFSNAQAATLKDGTYSVNYTVLKAEGNAVSMANDYWLKPAKVIAKNGKLTVQMTIKNSSWVTKLKCREMAAMSIQRFSQPIKKPTQGLFSSKLRACLSQSSQKFMSLLNLLIMIMIIPFS